jgi:nitroreductase
MTQGQSPSPRAAHDGAFPEAGALDEQLRFMLNYAVLAPSVMNSQPWRFRVAAPHVYLYSDPARALPAVDPGGRELVISCGAALFNLRLAVRHYGYAETHRAADDPSDPDLLAVLTAGDATPANREEEALFGAIARRQTERRPFANLEVPGAVLRGLQEAAAVEGARLVAVTDDEAKDRLASLIAEAVRLQGRDAAALHDLREWLRANDDPRPDGVLDERQNPWARHSASRTPTEPVAVGTEHLAAESPALLILSTAGDDRSAWLDAGQALERVLLRATIHDLAASYLNQVTEVADLRSRLAEFVDGQHPQVVFRVGYPVRTGGSLRRRVEDVTITR